MVFGYGIKEEATEVKKELWSSRNNLILLLLGSVIGGVIVRAASGNFILLPTLP